MRRLMAGLFCVVVGAGVLSGCGFFSPYGSFHNMTPVQYNGLANKSVAIVVLVQPATLDEYPGTREEVSAFVIRQMQLNLPNTRILNPEEITAWQNSTINWFGLSDTDIGKHFDVDRVLFLEVLDYTARRNGGMGTLQGHLRVNCRVVETDQASTTATAPGAAASPPVTRAWGGVVEVYWPREHPLDPTQTNETILRRQVLDAFSDQLVGYFYDRRDAGMN